MKRVITDILAVILIGVCVFCGYKIVTKKTETAETIKEVEKVNEKLTVYLKEHEVIDKYTFDEIKGMNADFVAYLSFDSGIIDVPITRGSKYMTLDFYQKYSSIGNPFIEDGNNLTDDNLVIYGHNVFYETNQMFTPLMKFQKQDFYDGNRIFKLYLKDSTETYEITNVYKIMTEEILDHNYQLYDLSDESVFNEFIKYPNEHNLITAERSIEYGDKVVTFQTCTSLGGNEFLIVMAKKIGG